MGGFGVVINKFNHKLARLVEEPTETEFGNILIRMDQNKSKPKGGLLALAPLPHARSPFWVLICFDQTRGIFSHGPNELVKPQYKLIRILEESLYVM